MGVEEDGAPISFGRAHRIRSAALSEEREYMVSLPRSYAVSDAVYPTIYVLDGELHFELITGIARHLAWSDRMPEAIVVGVPARARTRELTPPADGAASAMLSFLTEELVPEVEGRYRAAPLRILVGHSLGGLFTIHALLETDAFEIFIASSPSLYWNDEALRKGLEERAAEAKSLEAFYFMGVGSERERPDLRAAVDALRASLERAAPPGLAWDAQVFADADHYTSVPLAAQRGLTAAFHGWRAFPLAFNGDDEGLTRHYADLAERFGYPVTIPENMLNALVYQLSRNGRAEAALDAAARNADAYPNSANAHDTLGEMLGALDDLEAAEAAYARACELAEQAGDPGLERYREHLQATRKRLEQ